MMACEFAGIDRRKIVLDPGFGFGKALPHNLALLANLADIVALERPVLVGLSRKSMLGALTGREDPADRLAGSLAAAMLALEAGALILRVHDVGATVDAVKVWQAVRPLRRAPRPSSAEKRAKSALEALFDDE
jgi:dihydropteroate synthase